jgi:hypothetical protein
VGLLSNARYRASPRSHTGARGGTVVLVGPACGTGLSVDVIVSGGSYS